MKNCLWMSKPQALFTIPSNLDYPIFFMGSVIALKANLASVIKVTLVPSIGNSLVSFFTASRAKMNTTFLPKVMM